MTATMTVVIVASVRDVAIISAIHHAIGSTPALAQWGIALILSQKRRQVSLKNNHERSVI